MPPRLFGALLVLTLVLAVAAGFSLELTAQDTPGPHLVPLVISSVAFAGAFILGLQVGSGSAADDEVAARSWPEAEPGTPSISATTAADPRHGTRPPDDGRAILLFIYWPIVIVSVGVAGLVLWLFASTSTIGGGSGLPMAIMLVLAALGVFALPILIRATARAFRGRGFRGFWGSFRRTEWGDGIPPVP